VNFLKRNSPQKRARTKSEQKKLDKKWLIGLVITSCVSLIAGGLLSPVMSAFLENIFSPKPAISILRDETCIVPMWGENWVLIKTVIKNTGTKQEEDITVRWTVDSPWLFANNSTWWEYKTSKLPAGQATMMVINVYNPSVSELTHGTFGVTIRVFGATKVWDTAQFSESW